MDATAPDTAWAWQAWIGPAEIAASAKAETDADARAGAHHPLPGAPPDPADEDGQTGIWGVLTRASDPIPTPAGCRKVPANRAGLWLGVGS